MIWLDERLLKIFLLSQRWSKTTLVLFAIALTFSSLQIHQVKTDLSLTGNQDPTLQSVIHSEKSKEEFKPETQIVLLLKPQDRFRQADLCQISNWITGSGLRVPGVQKSQSVFDLKRTSYVDEKLHYETLIPDPCLPDSFDFEKIKKDLAQSTLTKNIFSKDLNDVLISFQLNPEETDGVDTYHGLVKAAEALNFKKFWIGEPVLMAEMKESFEKSIWTNGLIVLLILLFMRWAYGSFRSGLGLIFIILTTNLLVHNAMGFFGYPIDAITMGLFPLLSVAAIEDFIFLSHVQSRLRNDWLIPYKKILLQSFFTSLSTAIGFGALVLSSTPSIRSLGLWAAVGAMLEWVICFIALPAVAKHIPSLQYWSKAQTDKKITSGQFQFRVNPKIAWGMALVAYLAVPFFANFKITNSINNILPKNHPFQTASKEFLQSRGWQAQADLLIKKNISSVQRLKIINFVQAQDVVKGTDDIQSISNDFTKSLPASLAETIRSEIEYFFPSFYSYGELEKVHVYIKDPEISGVESLRKAVAGFCPQQECFLTGQTVIFAEDSYVAIPTLFESLWTSLVMVSFILLALTYLTKELRNFIPIVLCSFWSVAVVIVIVGLFDLPINATTCIIASVLIGLTGDNTIQFLLWKESDLNLHHRIQNMASASWHCSALTSLISLTMLFSPFMPLHMLGLLLAIGIQLAYVGDVVLQDAMIEVK